MIPLSTWLFRKVSDFAIVLLALDLLAQVIAPFLRDEPISRSQHVVSVVLLVLWRLGFGHVERRDVRAEGKSDREPKGDE